MSIGPGSGARNHEGRGAIAPSGYPARYPPGLCISSPRPPGCRRPREPRAGFSDAARAVALALGSRRVGRTKLVLRRRQPRGDRGARWSEEISRCEERRTMCAAECALFRFAYFVLARAELDFSVEGKAVGNSDFVHLTLRRFWRQGHDLGYATRKTNAALEERGSEVRLTTAEAATKLHHMGEWR